MEIRTSGSKGTREQEGVKETREAEGSTGSMAIGNAGDLTQWNLNDPNACQVETGKDNAPGPYCM